ncbi:hypothetical protein E9993_20260 [Labilibacter sediminis]|nr:hypothetical protein E9993_20260 [Labilibacter sediminis]
MFSFVLSCKLSLYAQQPNDTPNDTVNNQNKSIQEYLKDYSENSYINRKLYEWLVVSADSELSLNEILFDIEEEYKKYNNKPIRNINIKKVSPFAKNILDTLDFTTNKVEKGLSQIRFETKESVIRNALTFKKGEFVNTQHLYDSERILRSLSFITEALILVEPAMQDTSMVDILVITQDSYPYGVNASAGSNPKFGFYSKNILGYGIEMNHTIYTTPTNKNNFGIYESVTWNNIYGSYLTFDADYANYKDLHRYKLGINKRFFTPEIKYAGGFNITHNYKIEDPDLDSTKNWSNNHSYLYQNYWFGRSFLINADNFFDRSNFSIMGQSILTRYYNTPDSLNKLPQYKPNLFILASFAFSKRNFYKNNLIYNYGRTEDVPYGFLLSTSFGYNYNQLKTRYYLGGHFSFGKALIPNKGYFYFSGDYRSFLYNNIPEETIINLQANYISSLINIGKQRWRSFLSTNYVKGYNQTVDDYIYINEQSEGLRAYNSYQLQGTRKFVLSTENIVFSSRQTLGFKVAFFTFYDMAWIATDKNVFKNKAFYSLGGGFRIRNDQLVINTIQIQLAYFPRIPPGGIEYNFRLSGEQVSSFKQFEPPKPYTDVYK